MDEMGHQLDDFWAVATARDTMPGFAPYPYQRRLAEQGLPELVEVPTGCGKTMVILAWLWRRLRHESVEVRSRTPRRLVYVLPQRTLVEQVADQARRWVENLGLIEDVPVYVLMGGESRETGAWRINPESSAIIVATQDMALSGALNRRYGESRWTWPIDFGLLNNDCAWVFDEIQLMGPGLPTSRQLAALRESLGTALDCTSTWMSATVDLEAMSTVDRPSVGERVALSGEDRSGSLARRLGASRTVEQFTPTRKTYVKDLAATVASAHVPGTRTLVICNTVGRATELYRNMTKRNFDVRGARVVLVHSRFRPGDRRRHLDIAVGDVDPTGPGVVVVSTQVLEAGVDVTSETLVTEAAPWSSLVQRAGRCNRLGDRNGSARLLWCEPPDTAPYEADDVADSVRALTALEAQSLTTADMVGIGPRPRAALHAVLRRRDLLELFDTLPDLSGGTLDVTRFIRDADERDVSVAWSDLGGAKPPADHRSPARDELCSAPLSDSKAIAEMQAWWFDSLRGDWTRCRLRDLRPGMLLLLDSVGGGYRPETGWDPKSREPVEPAYVTAAAAELVTDDDIGSDPATVGRGRWLSLSTHLADVEAETARLLTSLEPSGLTEGMRHAAVAAAAWHDWGKVHPVFQETLSATIGNDGDRVAADAAGEPWAKSAGSKRSRHSRRFFRHELASALALLGDGSFLLHGMDEPDLAVYLVGAHHGRVRLGFRSLPDEVAPPDRPDTLVALGIVDGDTLPATEGPHGRLPAAQLDLAVMQLGSDVDGAPSWSQRMLPLRDRADLGPFRLGFLEAVVRMADWRASASADGLTPEVLP